MMNAEEKQNCVGQGAALGSQSNLSQTLSAELWAIPRSFYGPEMKDFAKKKQREICRSADKSPPWSMSNQVIDLHATAYKHPELD